MGSRALVIWLCVLSVVTLTLSYGAALAAFEIARGLIMSDRVARPMPAGEVVNHLNVAAVFAVPALATFLAFLRVVRAIRDAGVA
jgi:hypothetical protein